MTNKDHNEKEFLPAGRPGRHTQAKETSKRNTGDQETLGGDYWNRVAQDVASGYKNKKDKDSILNEDQVADDHELG